MSEASRLAGVFIEPSKTFEDVAARPRFWVPLILVILNGLLLITLVTQDRMIRQAMEKNPETRQLPADQRERTFELATRSGPMLYGFTLIGTPLTFLILAAIYLGIVKGIMSAPVTFKQAFAVVAYGWMPYVLSGVLTIVVLFLRSPADLRLDDLLVFNPGAFMDRFTNNKFVLSMASSFDVFTLWSLFLMGIGVKVAGSRKLSTRSAMVTVFLPWSGWILCKAALAGLG